MPLLASASLESYEIGDKITVLMNLQGNNDKDKIIRKARFVVGYSGKWQLTGTVYEETAGKTKQSLADARARIQGLRILAQTKMVIILEKEDKFVLSDGGGTFPWIMRVSQARLLHCRLSKEGYKNAGMKVTLGQETNVSISLSPIPEEDHPSYEYISSKTCKKCHGNIYNDWQDSDMANAAINPINQLVFLLYTSWYVTL